MSGKHTSGPWKSAGVSVTSADGLHVCDVNGYGATDETKRANAALIAAAPDMLEALRSAVALLTDPDAGEFEANDVLGELEAAIRKATGGEGGGV